MKKGYKRLLCAFMILCLVLSGTVLVFAEDVQKGVDFNGISFYDTASISIPLPTTFEATVCMPKNFSGRGGVIMGNYDGSEKPLFNFEIHNGGAPRIYINDASLVNYDVTFNNVNLYNGKPTHVAITYDDNSAKWYCYVDGVLKDSVSKATPAQFNITSKFRLGADYRSGNAQYFKGVIQKVALYSDMRTANEIAADAAAISFDASGLITAYDLSQNTLGEYPSSIDSVTDYKFNFRYRNEWLKDVSEPENYAYSFAVIGDIQTLTYSYGSDLTNMYEWIRDNAQSKKIKYVIGLGDVTEKNKAGEYELVNSAYDIIDGVVPYSIIRGNHDRSGTSSQMFDTYITKERYGDEISGSYDNTMKNTYRIIEVGEVKYMFMNLDYLLKDEVLEWAGEVISQNSDCRVIVSTHIYINGEGDYYPLTGSGGIGTKYGCVNNGQGLWDKLLYKYENVVMLLCGHHPTDDIYVRQKIGKNGNKVTEMLIDPQTTDKNYGGTGLVTMFYFSESGNQVDVRYYSTANDAYFKSNNQFRIRLGVTQDETKPPLDDNDIPAWGSPPSQETTTDTANTEATPASVIDTETEGSNVGVVVAIASVAVVSAGGIGTFLYVRKRRRL